MFGTLSSEDAICARLGAAVDVVVLNINYRHTPEFRYPTAWLDAQDAVKWAGENAKLLSGDPERIFVGGISAGGNLSASLTLQQALGKGKWPKVKGQLLMIPNLVNADCYDLQLSKMKNRQISSLEENKDAPILNWTRIRQFTDMLKVGKPDPDDRVLSPGNATDEEVKGVPPTVIIVAGLDPTRDEGLLYGKQLAENSVPTKVYLLRGVPHGFRRFGSQLSASERWERLQVDGLRWLIGASHEVSDFEVHAL